MISFDLACALAAIAGLRSPLLIVDESGLVVWCSPAAAELWSGPLHRPVAELLDSNGPWFILRGGRRDPAEGYVEDTTVGQLIVIGQPRA